MTRRMGNQLEGEIDIEDIPGISSSIENEHITLPISEIYGDAALDQNEPTLPRKQKFKDIQEITSQKNINLFQPNRVGIKGYICYFWAYSNL